ncbi:hypothetical protein ACNPP3_004434 [Vibrio vulnificus]|uniref:hypothetical protein n=1 Tax=Vibrio vulnificus TaxID=672 RepID=UPI0009273310|nr:hypothetical protein [Vibrio vulnificus]OJI30573.1 hypothetical protein VV99743_03393 [Vibrio vulnificus]HEJ2470187.1 hypothetical protein [Vibrio cholerae]
MYKGTHGTCRTWGEQIRENGFAASKAGRAGPGCYFWRYLDDNDYANFLAFRWWQAEEKRGEYSLKKGVKDPSCAVLDCSFDVDDVVVLDLSHGELKEDVRILIKSELNRLKLEGLPSDMTEEDVVSSLFQTYIDTVGEEEGVEFKLVVADVAIPKGSGGKIGMYFGASAEAIVVLDPLCININGYEEIENYEYI